jgi:hypothetical protein
MPVVIDFMSLTPPATGFAEHHLIVERLQELHAVSFFVGSKALKRFTGAKEFLGYLRRPCLHFSSGA